MSQRSAQAVAIDPSHLGEKAFAELAFGSEPNPQATAHLSTCARCREELAGFHESVEAFSLASLAWSEDKSEALAPLRPAAASAGPLQLAFRVQALSWALAALLVAGIMIPVEMHIASRSPQANAALSDDDGSGLNSPEQIAKDNELMAEVSAELIRSQATLTAESARQSVAARRGTRP